MLKSYKTWVLIALLVGPVAAYMGLGFLWLVDKGWLAVTLAAAVSIISGVLFYILGARWTKPARQLLPPIDWNSPSTFAPTDRQAWSIVQEEAEKGETVAMEALLGADAYIDTGRRLANRLAKHYHPLSEDPIENVAVLELLTALELAAEDLNQLCRQIPGGDLITTGHWKTAVQAAGYLTKANTLYSYLLPLFNPITGLPRLVSQHLMVKPAWKTMQQNMLRWFYQAYVNRLGIHLIELYSGRLVIGAEQYRRLTRKMNQTSVEAAGDSGPLTIVVAGARGSGHDRLVEAIAGAQKPDDGAVARARLKGAAMAEPVFARLIAADWVEVPGYTAKPDRETARDRSTRRHAVSDATEADLLVLLIDDRHGSLAADAAFAADWDGWYIEHPTRQRPPVVVAIVSDDVARVAAARAVLPPTISQIVTIDPTLEEPMARLGVILPAVAVELPRAERVSLLRHLQRIASRSKAGRLVRQVGARGKWLLGNLRRPKSEKPGQAADRPEATTKV